MNFLVFPCYKVFNTIFCINLAVIFPSKWMGHVAHSSVIVITMQQASMNLQTEKQTPEGPWVCGVSLHGIN